MRDDRSWVGPSLCEETYATRGYALELLFSIVVVSIFLGLSINLTASWLFQAFHGQVLFIIIICSALVLLTIIAFVPRLLITTKEFYQGIEILLPLLILKQDMETIRVRYYGNVTELLHAALVRHPAEERKRIAQILQSTHDNNAAATGQEIALFVLKLIQFLFAVRIVQGSARLLVSQALPRRSCQVMQLQSSTIISQWYEQARHKTFSTAGSYGYRGVFRHSD